MKNSDYIAYELLMHFFNLSEKEQQYAMGNLRCTFAALSVSNRLRAREKLLWMLTNFIRRHVYAKAKEVAGDRAILLQMLQDIVVYDAVNPQWSNGRARGDFMQATVTLLIPRAYMQDANFVKAFEDLIISIKMESGDTPEDYALCYNGVEVGSPKYFVRLWERKDHPIFKSIAKVDIVSDRGLALPQNVGFKIAHRFRELTGMSQLFSVSQISEIGIFAIGTTMTSFDEGEQIGRLRQAIYEVFDLNVDEDIVTINWFNAA